MLHNVSMSSESESSDVFASRKATLIATAVAIACVALPFWFWMDTWFGKSLTDAQIEEYLTDTERPRRAQHAIAQKLRAYRGGGRICHGVVPQGAGTLRHELPELRLTVAWLMGDDPLNEEFHRALRVMIEDPHPMVRRNAALALANLATPAGAQKCAPCSSPHRLASEHAGTVMNRLEPGDSFDAGALLVRVQQMARESPWTFARNSPGILDRQLHADGDRVDAGEAVTVVRPESTHVLQALLGLYLSAR